MPEKDPKPKRCGRLALPLVVAVAVLGLLAALFFALGFFANRTRIPPELLAPPKELARIFPAPASSAPGKAPVKNGPLNAPTPATPATPPQSSYASILREKLRANPNLEGARLYLELLERSQAEKWDLNLQHVFRLKDLPIHSLGERDLLWDPRYPLTAAQADWLRTHAEVVALALRFAESDGLPLLDRDLDDPRGFPAPSLRVLTWSALILAAESRRLLDAESRRLLDAESRRLLDAGALAESLRDIQAIFRLAAWSGRDPSINWLCYLLSDSGGQALVYLIEHGGPAPAALKDLGIALGGGLSHQPGPGRRATQTSLGFGCLRV